MYADESGVFDNKPESSDYFVYGGIVVSADAKRTLEHRYLVDEHSTATSGMHSLAESVDEEFRRGIYTSGFRGYKPPLFGDGFPAIPVCYLDSRRVPLIRAADITANYGWHVMNDSGPDSEAFERMRANASFLSLP